MRNPTNIFSGAYVLLGASVAIIGVFLYYFIVVVHQREDRIIDRGYRVLDNIGKNIREKKSNYDQSITGISPGQLWNVGFLNSAITRVFEWQSPEYFKNDSVVFVRDNATKKICYFKKHPKRHPFLNKVGGSITAEIFFEGVKYDDMFANITVFDRHDTYYNSGFKDLELNKADTVLKQLKQSIGPAHMDVVYGDEEYILFVEPLGIEQQDVYIGGLLSKQYFLSKSREFNPYLLFAGSVVIVFLVVCLPLMKLWLINKYEQIRVSDAVASVLTLIFGGSLLTLFAFSLYQYFYVTQDEIDNKLTKFGEQISTAFLTETDSIIAQLQSFPIGAVMETDKDAIEQATWVFHPSNPKMQIDYPNFNEILYIDDSGFVKQFISYDFQGKSSLDPQLYDLKSRDYFSRVHDKRAWTHPKASERGLFIQSIYSWSKGSGEAAISMSASVLDTAKNVGWFEVMALTAPLATVMKTIVPEGYGFAVVNPEGLVQFHSDTKKNLMENFFAETNNDPKLLAAVRHHQSAHLNLDYNATNLRALTIPVKDLPFVFIVYYNMQYAREMSARVIITAFTLILFSCIILALVFFLGWMARKSIRAYKLGESAIDWLRFHPKRHGLYTVLLMLSILCLLIQLLYYIFQEDLVSIFSFNLSLTIFISLFYNLVLRYLNVERQQGGTLPRLMFEYVLLCLAFFIVSWSAGSIMNAFPYIIAGGIFLLILQRLKPYQYLKIGNPTHIYQVFVFCWICCMSVIPTISLFKVIQQDEERLWLRSTQFAIFNDYMARLDKLDEQYDKGNLPDSKLAHQKNRGIYYNFIGNSGIAPDYTTQIGSDTIHYTVVLDSASAEIYEITRPVIAGYHEQVRGLLNPKTADYLWSWYRTRNNPDTLLTIDSSNGSNANRRLNNSLLFQVKTGTAVNQIPKYFTLVSDLPEYRLPSLANYHGRMFWFLSLVSLALGYMMVNFVLKRIFHWQFVNNLAPMTVERELKKILHGNKKILIEGFNTNELIAGFLKELPASLKPATIVSFSRIMDNDEISSQLANNKCLLIKDFIYGSGEEKYEAYRRMLMEKINASGKTVVIFVENGLKIFFEQLNSHALSSAKAEQREGIRAEISAWKNLFAEYKPWISRGDGLVDPAWIEESSTSNSHRIDDLSIDITGAWGAVQYLYAWNMLTKSQKLVMYDLANNSIVNTRNKAVVKDLILKGLISVKDHNLQLADWGWSAFMENAAPGNELKKLQKELRMPGNWHTWRVVIFTTIIALGALLFLSEKEVFNQLNGVVGGVAALIPVLFKLFESKPQQQTE